MEKQWYKSAAGYQIFPKSFFDSNNDGIGDLNGITSKLDYLKSLEIDFIWICPFFDSPMDDNGYDVRDFFKIASIFGNESDLENLVKEAKKRDIKIFADLVLNHTSDEHEWFKKALNGEKKYQDYYIIKSSDKLPNNWKSFFGGSAWERFDDKSYYLKIFSKKMPDLNWENIEVRKAMYEITNKLAKLGIAGFRVDAISHLSKDLEFKDVDDNNIWSGFSNRPELFKYLNEFKEEVLDNSELVTVGEVGGEATITEVRKFTNVFNMVFNFDHVSLNNMENALKISDLKTDVVAIRNVFKKWQEELSDCWQPLYIANHDHYRAINEYGSEQYRFESATMLAVLFYMQKGTPFIYQGEEIGMSNYPFESIDELNDVQTIGRIKNNFDEKFRVYYTSRDNNRTPMQWDNSKYAGFSKHKPWLSVNANYSKVNVETQQTGNTILNFYRTILKLKKSDDVLLYGVTKFIDNDNNVISYTRSYNERTYLIICNMRDIEVEIQNIDYKKIIVSNYNRNLFNTKLSPFETYILEI